MAEGSTGIDLGKKAGPLPIGAWIAVVGGGLAIGWYFNKKNSNTQSSLVAETGVGVGPGGKFLPVDPADDTPSDKTETNEAWRRKAFDFLVSLGLDPGKVDAATRKYIYGEPLTLQEQAIVNQAILKLGLPPEALPPVDVPEPEPRPPDKVGAVTVTGRTSFSIRLSWTPVFGASGYEVKVTSSKGAWNAVPTLLPVFDSALYGTLSSGVEHTFTIWAKNAQGLSEPTQIKATPSGSASSAVPSAAPPPPPPAPVQRRYTIVRGDTLWSISGKMYGNSARWMEIYNTNAGAIEDAARRNGRPSSRGGPVQQVGWYIYPGVSLVIP